MKGHKVLNNLGLVFILWFCSAFICNSGNEPTSRRTRNNPTSDSQSRSSNQTDNPTYDDSSDDDSIEPGVNPSTTNTINLSGTEWDLISMTPRGQGIKEMGTTPNVEFCTNGNWVQQNYPNDLVGGTYRVSGNRLV